MGLKRDKIIQISELNGGKDFVSKRMYDSLFVLSWILEVGQRL